MRRMKKLSVIPVVLALALVVAAPVSASAPRPPSFALWMAARDARVAHLVAPLENKCLTVAKLTSDDDKAGECIARGLLPLFAAPWTPFDRGIARISAPQTPACKRAIHAYWKAMHTSGAAMLIYLRSNQHPTATDLDREMHTGTIGTLSNVSDEAKSHAIRICG